ncbi:hypothetical protein Cantr_00865 [Candida viswanathii]|uniref:F-box domain-containing protein n=1 Tax=Candida viswanathii TaxID=5486 RepID=A0A367YG18_9ASCO|nr:hypothetical protein Cantr_00865 [Candida viswanathii]
MATNTISTIAELPHEIIQRIINYLPRALIVELTESPQLKKYALTELYSFVAILSRDVNSSDYSTARTYDAAVWGAGDEDENCVPKFGDFNQLLSFVQEHNLRMPKYIRFRNPIDILNIQEPEKLDNSFLRTTLKDLKYSGVDIAYVKKLKELPYKFDEIDDFYILDELVYGDNREFTRNLSRLEISFEADLAPELFFPHMAFENLNELQVGPRLSAEQVAFLPRTLKSIKCSLNIRGLGKDISASRDVIFPPGLRKLYTNVRHDVKFWLDLTSMEHLQSLCFFSSKCCGIDFPCTLRELTVYSGLNMYKVAEQCRQLYSLNLNELLGDVEHSDVSPEFPQGLRKLNVDIQTLQYMARSKNDPAHVALPQTLVDLRIYGSNENVDAYLPIMNYDFKPFTSLTKLSLPFASGTQIESFNLENLPQSLTHILMGNLGIKNLAGKFTDLPNLQEIGMPDNRLAEYFSDANENLRDAEGNIFGPNVKLVVLDGNRFTEDNLRLVVDDLMKKRHFRSLLIDQDIIPKDMKHLQDRGYIIGLGSEWNFE